MFNHGLPKKSSGRILAVTTTVALALAGSIVATAPANAAINIPDDGLGDCITAALPAGTATSGPQLETAIRHLTGTLNCTGRVIHSLTGIDALEGITSLDLSHVDLTGVDLEPLGDLTQLLNLDLSHTGIGDGQLTDILGPEGLTKLLGLDLAGNNITGLLGIDSLQNLLDLDLSDNPLDGLNALLPLNNLGNLLSLDLSGDGLTSLLGLDQLTDLLQLDLSGNALDSLDLANLPVLKDILDLDLSGNDITDLSTLLTKLSEISNLDLTGNPITDVLQLDALQNALTPVTKGDLGPLLASVNDLLQGLLGEGSAISNLLEGLGLDVGELHLGDLLGGLLGDINLGDNLDLDGLLDGVLDGLGLDSVTNVVFPPTTIITPAGPAGPAGNNGSNGSNGSNGNGSNGSNGSTGSNGSNGTTGTSDNASISSAGTPTITGTTTFGQTLTANPGAWDATTLTYQWYRGVAPIVGATGTSYKLAAADIGNVITVHVTGAKAGATSITNSSAPTKKVVAAKFKVTKQPKITGKLKKGKTLKGKVTGISKTVKASYQWFRTGKKIAKATKATYKVTAKDKGKKITVKVTYKKSGYSTVTRASASKKIAK
jgi:hypothetical protein